MINAVLDSHPLSRSSSFFVPSEIIPKFIMLLRRGQKLTLHGGGHQRRRYLYAGDAANAFNVVLHNSQNGDIFNLGASTDEITNRDLSARLVKIINPASSDSSSGESLDEWITTLPGRPYADSGSKLDCAKLRALGWQPSVGFDEGLKRTAEWYAQHGDSWWGDISKIFG